MARQSAQQIPMPLESTKFKKSIIPILKIHSFFFTCTVADIPKLEEILEDYLPGGKYEYIFWDNGTARNGLKKYIEYLRSYHFKKPQVILLHKHPANVDITKMIDDNTLQAIIHQKK